MGYNGKASTAHPYCTHGVAGQCRVQRRRDGGLVQHRFLLILLLLVLPLLLDPLAVVGVLSKAGGADKAGGSGEASDNAGGGVLVHGVGEESWVFSKLPPLMAVLDSLGSYWVFSKLPLLMGALESLG